ncbi:hypothetical protein BDV95DRAFT_486129 [Massariosphaeria phaeospora]|uniref:Uncharacterized protein n=1 Tax=Massariosphaeria phaeospora TaxID=100035 RepID=A0A7C8IEA8_9PLEO|nr:hypothetical protein BDV95DRAFT_486129 [Massariosphaeria phaeospora]
MHIHDVLIIGAGPCGLAVAARLREHTPSATFTDDEHQRFHWIRKHGGRMNLKNHRTKKTFLPTLPRTNGSATCGCKEGPSPNGGINMLVLDADGGDWMTKWNRLFKTFGIQNLRSPMFFHVDPADRDALLGYTYEKQRETELQALPGCAGKELSKHRKKKKMHERGKVSGSGPDIDERDRKDYFTPSAQLFSDHCAEIVKRYALGNDLVRQERVIDLEYNKVSSFHDLEPESIKADGSYDDDRRVFRVTTDQGARLASVVILAVGPGNAPSIPLIPGLPCGGNSHEGYCHAMQIKQFPPPYVAAKIRKHQTTNMLIVGGGLTSVQLADLAIKRGVSKVWLLMRGPVKVKYFDVELDWVGKFRNFKQAAFWTADTDQERSEMIMQARNGGSITPRYRKILDTYTTSGKISLHTHTTLQSLSWDTSAKVWTTIESAPPNTFPSIDYMVFATGIQSNIETLPFLQAFQEQHPINCAGYLPCINDDLMWSDDIPLFVTGRLVGLRLGPGAPNLVGARIGAERIAWNVEDVLQKMGRRFSTGLGDDSDSDSDSEKLHEYACARRNRFDSLVES